MEKKIKRTRITQIDSADEKPELKQSILDSVTPSTELCLFDKSWTAYYVFLHFSANVKKEAIGCEQCLSENLKRKKIEQNIAKMRDCKETDEDKRKGISTELKLFDPCKIKKKLTDSDLGNLSRLLVHSELVKTYTFSFLNEELIDQIKQNGVKFLIYDCDTETEHYLVFKRWSTSKSYVFNGGWMQNFGKRRNLREGDLIGLYWDLSKSRFNFSVLERA